MSRIFMVLVILLYACDVYSITPKEAFDKGKAKISAAKSLTADFSMNISGQTFKGKIYSKGTKFAITSNANSSWYNGKDLYTYNSSQGQTYVFRPNNDELREANPLLYLTSAADYKISGSKAQKAGVETIVLIPKKSGSGVRSVTIDLDSKSFLPKAIKVVPSSGAAIAITVSNLNLNGSVADNIFEYPKSKYPNVTVTDLR